jgi:hypothetical protein
VLYFLVGTQRAYRISKLQGGLAMKTSAWSWYVAAAFLSLIYTATAQAIPITFSFTGGVTNDPFGLSSLGAPISGNYTFESTAVDAIPAANTGSYTSIGPGFGFNATVDGNPFSVSGSLNVSVLNSLIDQYLVTATDGTLTLELFFQDNTGTALASDALPLTPPPLAAFAIREFRLFAPDAEFTGSVDTLVCSAGCNGTGGTIPEPGTLWLLGASLAALLVWRRLVR